MYFSKQELLVSIKLGYFVKPQKNEEKYFSRNKKKFCPVNITIKINKLNGNAGENFFTSLTGTPFIFNGFYNP